MTLSLAAANERTLSRQMGKCAVGLELQGHARTKETQANDDRFIANERERNVKNNAEGNQGNSQRSGSNRREIPLRETEGRNLVDF